MKGFITIPPTQSNRVCCFKTLDAVFPTDLFSDYLEISKVVVVLYCDPTTSPHTSTKCCSFYILHFLVRLHCRVPHVYFLNPGLGVVMNVAAGISALFLKFLF